MNTASVCLLACASTMLAMDVQPAPGLHLGPVAFSDVRVMLGIAAPVTDTADGSGGGNVGAAAALGPQGGVQWVHGRVESIGWGLGLELSAAEHRGDMQGPAPLNGSAIARVVSLSVLPKLILRPEGVDPFEFAPGFFQVEIGPILGCGAGQAGLSNSNYSDPFAVVKWGGRLEAVFTTQTGMQVGLSIGYEDFKASPKWDAAEGDLSVSGFTGGLSIGWRLR